jgi:hypothetical protein
MLKQLSRQLRMLRINLHLKISRTILYLQMFRINLPIKITTRIL